MREDVIEHLSEPILPAYAPGPDADLPDVPAHGEDRALVEPIAQTILSEEPPLHEGHEPRDIGALLLVMAVVAGSLAVSLSLAGEARLVVVSRIILAAVDVGMLLGRAATTVRDACDPHPGPVLALVDGVARRGDLGDARERSRARRRGRVARGHPGHGRGGERVARRERAAPGQRRARVDRGALAVPGRRAFGEGEADSDAAADRSGDRRAPKPSAAPKEKVFDIRSGEHIVVETGEVVPVDVTLTGATSRCSRGSAPPPRRAAAPGIRWSPARVVRGSLRGVCTWAGHDRAFARMLVDPAAAPTPSPRSPAPRLALAERWAIVASFIGAVAATVAHRNAVEISHDGRRRARRPRDAGDRLDRRDARGARHPPRPAPRHRLQERRRLGSRRPHRRRRVLRARDDPPRRARARRAQRAPPTPGGARPSLRPRASSIPARCSPSAAGAERSEAHPIAAAIVRAARTRGLRPDGVRNPNLDAGLGVTAVSSSGEELCVGSRALMLDRRISIASAETRIAELESLGRTVVLVALGSRLVGLLGLQDGLRPGARAAVQHLLDAQIEPVLMSGDSRETCEAIGRSLDIDHIRPEVLPAGRSAEVRSLIESGLSVAVLGHADVDDAALGAADVAIALAAAGSTPGDYAVTLASDDVRDAALALALAHRARNEARLGLALAAVPALIGATAIAFGLLPPAYAPIASLLGGAMAVAHIKRTT